MKKYFLAGITGCALGALVSVKVAEPVLAQDTETKKNNIRTVGSIWRYF